jgi:hypothetical protein
VDALCIDQDNVEERDEQVAKMDSIYSSARRVIIWLGEETEETKGSFTLLRRAHDSMGQHRNTLDDNRELEDWSPVLNLLRRSWFQRTWIIQEAVLAREPLLACGFETIPYSMLGEYCSRYGLRESMPEDPLVQKALDSIHMIDHARREHHTRYRISHGRVNGRTTSAKLKYTPKLPLVTMLYETRGFRCKDKRDKVFGILSLVLDVEPDDEVRRLGYANSVEEVYETVAKWDISKNRSLEVLSYCSGKERTQLNLPSWVPDFSDMDDALPISVARKVPLPGSTNARVTKRGLEGNNGPCFSKEDGRTVLTLSGTIVDTISRVGRVADHSNTAVYTHPEKGRQSPAAGANVLETLNPSAIARRREWFEECVRIAQASDPVNRRSSSRRAIDFLGSPTLGMSSSQFSQFWDALTMRDHMGASTLHGYANFLSRDPGAEPDWGNKWNKDHQWVDRRLGRLSHKRRFCATREGKLGLVPRNAKEGDLVCLLSGAHVPIILRRVPGTGDREHYMVVGDAHLESDLYLDRYSIDCYKGGERLAIV